VGLLAFAFASWLATHTSSVPVVFGRWSLTYSTTLALLFAGAISMLLLATSHHSRFRALRNYVGIGLFTIVTSLGLAEVAVRVFDPFGISYYEESARYQANKLADSELYYTHTPNSSGRYQGVDVRINSLGMRDSEVADKAPGEYRVLFLGDSVTFGWGVADEYTFVRRLGPMLGEWMSRPVRTLNSAVGSYNTDNQWGFLKRYGKTLDPDLVLLMYFTNDIEPTPSRPFDPKAMSQLEGKSPPQISRWVLGRSWLYRSFVHFGGYARSYVSLPQDVVLSSPGWHASAQSVRSIAQWCDENGVAFVAFLARMRENSASDAVLLGLKGIGTDMDFLVFDAQPWFEGRDVAQLVNSLVDPHATADGHLIFAEGISRSLREARISD
jgi:hypothetical protein